MKKGLIATATSIAGVVTGALVSQKINNRTIRQKEEKIEKFKSYYNLLNQWLCLKQEGKNLADYFQNNQYKTVAIYGMGELGNRLYEELKATSVSVEYAIDKNSFSTYSELEVFNLDDIDSDTEPVDIIVVTAVFAFDEIEVELQSRYSCPIVSLEDVVFEL